MKALFILLFFPFALSAQSVVGVWKTIDDQDGRAKSHLEVKEVDGKLTGSIIKLLDETEPTVCSRCTGEREGQELVGMKIFWGLKQKGDQWEGGKIFDPKTNKEYKCKISLGDNPDELKVRGFIGFSLMGRTQTWYRVKS